MCFTITEIKKIHVMRMSDNVTFSNARAFRDCIESLINDEPIGVVIDLKKVNFINSTGIGVLAMAHNKLQSSDKRLVLLNVRPEVIRVLKIIGFDSLIFMTDDEEKAVAYCL